MVRVKRGVIAHKKREKILKHTKGFKWGRKSKERAAKEALLHAWSHAYDDRKNKKRDFRRSWQTKIKIAAEAVGFSYNVFMNALKKAEIKINRKVLAEMAEKHPKIFEAVVDEVKKLIK